MLELIGLQDMWKVCGVGYSCTFQEEGLVPCLSPVMRIDCIFYQCWEGEESETGNETKSGAAALQPRNIHVVTKGIDRSMTEIVLCRSDYLDSCTTFAIGLKNRITWERIVKRFSFIKIFISFLQNEKCVKKTFIAYTGLSIYNVPNNLSFLV